MLARPFLSLHPDRVPAISRANYARELRYTLLFSTTLAIVEGGIIGVIVKNAYHGVVSEATLAAVVALLGAAPESANITSFLWNAVAHGRDKVRLINLLQMATAALVMMVALCGQTAAGLALLAVSVVGARVCIAGIVTLRAGLWRANYSRFERARATGKFSTVTVLVIAVTGMLLGKLMDVELESFRVFIPCVCLLGFFGLRSYGRIRLRGRAVMVKAEREGAARASFRPSAMIRLLRDDRNYARFMGSMFVLGVGNLMLSAPLVIALKDRFGQGYMGGIAVTSSIQYIVMPWFIPMWANLLARVHVVRFRMIHSWVFVLAQGVVLIAVVTRQYWLLFASSALLGIGFAGGSLAWNLGHLDFAPGPKAAQYMGVHVTLNGVRGILAPFFAVGVYRVLEVWRPGAGAWVFAFSVVLCILGSLGFMALGRSMGEQIKAPPREG